MPSSLSTSCRCSIRVRTIAYFAIFYLFKSRASAGGDCASEFQKLLANNPPELESKDTFIQWLCRVHNIVNERLLKPVFDCSVVKERWICGCVTEV